ncbi:MAG: ribose 5-phosphate isomerase B [Candidatus Marinimicrobia bacterium]|nr:ribose 5-phosphate isomerase B [Candidatus Neomarinimicrobiota bacterium]MCF7850996.1 ribose 5-phosphate isomerase B [Candidatus Neomarinimicrobiota bacterium]
MKIAIGSDHAAYEAKEQVLKHLHTSAHTLLDVGTKSVESCDYPDYAAEVSRRVQANEVDRGILICGTGIGMSIAANRFTGVRAALCTSTELAGLSREHNNANVLCLGARTQSMEDILAIIDVWLTTEWAGGRHAGRLNKIEQHARGKDVK